MVFGKANATEAKYEFKHDAIVSTLHSFAYQHVVKEYKLHSVKPFLTWRDMPKSIRRPFGKDQEILTIIDEYCKSDYTSIDDYSKHVKQTNPLASFVLFPYAKRILNAMASGTMPVTHSFYLKLFHVLVMNGRIQIDHVERLLVDEFQDMSGLALDIINAIPADQKVFVGDPNQAIFEFLKLQNGFAKYPDAKVLTLSKSFRVDQKYAPAIQHYLRTYLEPDAVFKGMEYPPNVKPVTKAYLTRTNAKLIAKMIELNKSGTPYHLSHKTKLKDMFKFPLAVIYAKPGFDQRDPELKHLQHDIDDWGSLPKSKRDKLSLLSYLKQENSEDTKITSAINLVLNFDRQDIIDAHDLAKEHIGTHCDLQLMTVHTSKGSTRDIIELDDDVNDAIKEVSHIPMQQLTDAQRSELCLGFVAISRHRHQLINCKFLTHFEEL